MSAADARTLIKQRTEHVIFILGRLKTKSDDMPVEPVKFVSTGKIILDAYPFLQSKSLSLLGISKSYASQQ